MRDLFANAPRHMKPRRPKPPSKYIRAAFNRKIERPKTTFEFDDALDVLPPGKDMRPRQRMPRRAQNSREFKLPERTLIFEGIATIEPAPKGWWQRTAR